MSSWKTETTGDLDDAARRIKDSVETVSGEPSDAQLRSVWRAYLLIEKSIAFIKVELDEENPGALVKLAAYSVPDERQALQFALRNLGKGIESFRLGDLGQALKELRESRNYLRVLLRQKRLKHLRETRG
ncbi:MAG TPA: hypothetical protein VKF39_04095 [Nitrososphaerales archaeon]|nr:hypothetical protein [Nitrososphaerales archaeon]